MSKKSYIALQAIQYVDENGVRRSIEPRSEKHSGLFEHEFDKKQEKRLLTLGAIREPEGTEEHEDPTAVEAMHDRREIDGDAEPVDPLDHDANGKKGGSKAGGNRKKAATPAPTEGGEQSGETGGADESGETKPSEELLG